MTTKISKNLLDEIYLIATGEATVPLNASFDFKYATWCDETTSLDSFSLVLVGYYT